MATSEALVKYYDCLRDSFNKIQDKDNTTALVNAALRPKIREEFVKSQDVLDSYLNYIQVFSLIYSDKFIPICNNIIIPIFKEQCPTNQNKTDSECKDGDQMASKIHESIQAILASKPELAVDLVTSVLKVFPPIHASENNQKEAFMNYLNNSLKICTYLKGEHLLNLVAKIIDKLNPPPYKPEEEDIQDVSNILNESYELIYRSIGDLHDSSLDRFITAVLVAYIRGFLASPNVDHINHLLLYICSLDIKFVDFFIKSLWATFINPNKPFEERKASVAFISSLLSRANYLDLGKILEFLETASNWCMDFLEDRQDDTDQNKSCECFYALTQSMFYLITQRYREMYEEETISRLLKLNLSKIAECSLKPLDSCEPTTQRRFKEVASLYQIPIPPTQDVVVTKKRKFDQEVDEKFIWNVPLPETYEGSIPERLFPLYRNYFDHRNFTVYRD